MAFFGRQKSAARQRPPMPIVQRALFWTCTNCNSEFRVYGGELPVMCPSCGTRRDLKNDNPRISERDCRFYRCPTCRVGIDMLDGREPKHCPACGREITPGTA